MRGPFTIGKRVWALETRTNLWRSSDGFAAAEGFFSGQWTFLGGKRVWRIVASIGDAATAESAFSQVSDRLDEILASQRA